ncbi:MAG: MerR family transcriptional regulator, partial [Dehalococcoidia bacterium]|nr:MerR family transcriptional regulator [Dehalococcoidia bacterium]
MVSALAAGWPHWQDGHAQPLHRRRHQRRQPAHGRHVGLQEHRRHQPRSRRQHGPGLALRHRRGLQEGRPRPHRGHQGPRLGRSPQGVRRGYNGVAASGDLHALRCPREVRPVVATLPGERRAPPDIYLLGSLRSKLVAKLTGLSVRTLQSWHSTDLQSATREPGSRGTPRYYSWVDYQRLCVVSSLREQDVPTRRIRQAIPNLDRLFPGWWEMSLHAYRGRVTGSQSKIHVTLRDSFDTLVDVPGGQMTFRDLMGDEAEGVRAGLAESLSWLEEKGALFRQASFRDSITMDPELNVAQPTVINT